MVEIYVKLDPEMQEQTEVTGTPPRPTFYDSSVHVHTCGGTGGWRRAVYLDMTDPNTDCLEANRILQENVPQPLAWTGQL